MKTCRHCRIEKPETEYHWKSPGKRRDECKVCRLEQDRKRRAARPKTTAALHNLENKELAKENKKRCNKCKEIKAVRDFAKVHKKPQGRCKACQRNYYYKNRDRIREQARNRHNIINYGMTYEERTSWMEDKACQVCRTVADLVVDHCHDTGKVRGILCRQCNSALGLLHESRELVRKLLSYINNEDTRYVD